MTKNIKMISFWIVKKSFFLCGLGNFRFLFLKSFFFYVILFYLGRPWEALNCFRSSHYLWTIFLFFIWWHDFPFVTLESGCFLEMKLHSEVFVCTLMINFFPFRMEFDLRKLISLWVTTISHFIEILWFDWIKARIKTETK